LSITNLEQNAGSHSCTKSPGLKVHSHHVTSSLLDLLLGPQLVTVTTLLLPAIYSPRVKTSIASAHTRIQNNS
jgi:hypothetical protein